MGEKRRRFIGFRSARGFRRGLTAAVLLGWAASAGAQGFRTEVFVGAGAPLVDEKIVTFDLGATAWLTERWGLGVWSSFPTVVGQAGTSTMLFNPAIRYQRRLRRGRSLHLAAGPGYVDSNGGIAGVAEWEFLPYADILYGIQAAGNRKFGLRVGARFIDYGLHFVGVLGFTTD